MKKKLSGLLILIVLAFILTGCKSRRNDNLGIENDDTQQTIVPESQESEKPSEDITDNKTDSPIEQETKAPTESPAEEEGKIEVTEGPTISPSVEPSALNTAEPTKKPTATKKPSSTKKPAATKKPSSTKKPAATKKPSPTKKPVETKVSLSDIHNAVKKAYGENYIPSVAYGETELEEIFGIKKEWYSEAVAEGPMISFQIDAFIAVKANKDNVNDIKNALESYKELMITESIQYPVNMPKLQASYIKVIDNYVFYIRLGSIGMDIEDEEKMLEAFEKQNDIAVNAIKKVMGKK